MLIILICFVVSKGLCQNCEGYPTKEQLLASLSNRLSPHYDINRYSLKCNVDDTVKNKIVKLLDNEWDTTLLNSLAHAYSLREFEYLYFDEIIATPNAITRSELYKKYYGADIISKNSKGDTSKTMIGEYKRVWDSIYQKTYADKKAVFETEYKEQLKKSRINDDVIRLCGYLFIKESEKKLLKALESPRIYSTDVIESSLARIGVKRFQEKIFARHRHLVDSLKNLRLKQYSVLLPGFYEDFVNLSFIGTQQSISLLADWMDTTFRVKYFGDGPANSFLGEAISRYKLIQLIQNEDFISIFHDRKTNYTLNGLEINAAVLNRMREWLIKNKGNYKINQQVYF